MTYGMWIWNWLNCEGGDPEKVAAKCAEIGLDHLVFKITDGTNNFNGNHLKPIFDMLRPHVALQCWTYTYGLNPEAEADAFGTRATALGAEAFVVDLEGDAYSNQPRLVERFLRRLRGIVGVNGEIILSSHRYPSSHLAVPIATAMSLCDAGDSQCYYVHQGNIEANVARSIVEWQGYGKPVIVTPAAYPEATGNPANIPIVADACIRRGVKTLRWWSWEHAMDPMWTQIQAVCRAGLDV